MTFDYVFCPSQDPSTNPQLYTKKPGGTYTYSSEYGLPIRIYNLFELSSKNQIKRLILPLTFFFFLVGVVLHPEQLILMKTIKSLRSLDNCFILKRHQF